MPCLVRSSFHSFRIHRSTGNANFIDLSADLGRWFTVAIPVSRLRRYRVEEGIRDPMDGNVDRERLRSPGICLHAILGSTLGCRRGNLRRQRGCLLFRGVKNKWVELGNVTSSCRGITRNPSLSLPLSLDAHFLETCIARRKVAWLCLQLLYIYIANDLRAWHLI